MCLFQCLTLPSRANKVFPYHVRTTQIGVMQVQDLTDSDTTFPFRHHQYAPSAPPRPGPNVHPLVGDWVTDVPFELFTVSQSIAMDQGTRPTAPKPHDTHTFQQSDTNPPPENYDAFLAPSQVTRT
ncbi:hypothetical protein L798_05626 [Zootermopsis nevadensis]|uniref:Uncharacterized protein n=1 Tax=Zootermopsis nevadensis TaxID=136037 RepID=A0A067RKU4_ZOONE|nr:hypothetical protein L798_05626 [Zootermopsis nevadensis]